MILEIFIWGVGLFIAWNLVSVAMLYSRRWVDRNKTTEDIINCKWRK
jgi:hypothetical protein